MICNQDSLARQTGEDDLPGIRAIILQVSTAQNFRNPNSTAADSRVTTTLLAGRINDGCSSRFGTARFVES
jgi:hypothetical protein